jgi:hypothetical protein
VTSLNLSPVVKRDSSVDSDSIEIESKCAIELAIRSYLGTELIFAAYLKILTPPNLTLFDMRSDTHRAFLYPLGQIVRFLNLSPMANS